MHLNKSSCKTLSEASSTAVGLNCAIDSSESVCKRTYSAVCIDQLCVLTEKPPCLGVLLNSFWEQLLLRYVVKTLSVYDVFAYVSHVVLECLLGMLFECEFGWLIVKHEMRAQGLVIDTLFLVGVEYIEQMSHANFGMHLNRTQMQMVV